MIAIDLGVERVDQVLRLVHALGAHRYVAGRLHLVHALAAASVGDDAGSTLGDAREWALATIEGHTGSGESGIDVASRDERLWRRSSDREVAAVLDAFWTPGARSRVARETLRDLLERHGLPTNDHLPFDPAAESTIHPMVIDAGWEFFGLRELDPDRHKGAIAAFGARVAFDSARLEEATASAAAPHLCELPALGAAELLGGADADGALTQPFVVWAQGNETYLDYVFRGVQRAARLP